ncbi:CHAD domain-containing protein [Pseudonocardia xishanensis]|uniref:CHAD domain-containing protein n=1 Tax=Pseudonocardia xishanensis TaxID=630995 RepID=A0ABP8S4R9_9PSEU
MITTDDLPTPLTAAPQDSPAHHVRAALDLRLRALLTHDPGTREGVDIEHLHQMRVAVRRMRAALKAARPLLDAIWADDLRAELGWLGRALGPVRDLDVLLLRLNSEIADLPERERAAGTALVASLQDEHAAARAEMLAVLESSRYQHLLERLADAIRLPLPTPSATRAQPELIDLVRIEVKKLTRAVRRAGDDPPDQTLHDLRIHGKRVRYVGELVEPMLGAPVKRLLKATAGLQEVLGDHQDACVAEQRIRVLLDGLGEYPDAHVVFVAGRLVERERARATEKRAEWWTAWEHVSARAGEI